MDHRPVRRVLAAPDAQWDPQRWPCTLPAVRQLLERGLDLAPGVTFLVGENGSGKSTLVEGIAGAYGLNPEGGSRGASFSTRPSESDLAGLLSLWRHNRSGGRSYFFRAETAHGLLTYLEDNPRSGGDQETRFHELSHGESFLELLRQRVTAHGFYLMDEPESALSFRSCLTLLTVLGELAQVHAQVLVATHSPLLCSLPGATILEVSDEGLREVAYDDLQLVQDWRSFLDAPGRWLRHLA